MEGVPRVCEVVSNCFENHESLKSQINFLYLFYFYQNGIHPSNFVNIYVYDMQNDFTVNFISFLILERFSFAISN